MAKTPKPPKPAKPAPGRPTIRMYRQGLGDCFLIRIPRADQKRPYAMLIDCGVILGQPDATARMRAVMADIVKETRGEIDLLVATHEHYDHLSGFVQAAAEFAKLKVGQVWMGWTEDPDDPVAQGLVKERRELVGALRVASQRLAMGGDDQAAGEVASLLSFFGAAGSTGAALEAARTKAKVSYQKPGKAKPFVPPGTDVRVYVLGPPTDLKLLRRHQPSSKHPETYELAESVRFLDGVGRALADDGRGPFDARHGLPLETSRGVPFFQQAYWHDTPAPAPGDGDEERRNDWRRIDTAWLGSASDFAIDLDGATNNSSLALAIELPGGEVLLFAADAQVGNWLSWKDLSWKLDDGRTVTGPDLIARTTVYKVGHHGSHNATLREDGLERMDRLEIALAPVDERVAHEVKKWVHMPLPSLMKELERRASHFVLRPDRQPKPHPRLTVDPGGLWFEIVV